MEISKIIEQKESTKEKTTVTTGLNYNTTVTTVGNKYKLTESLYTELNDLVNQRFKAWYCREFHRLGKDKVLCLASIARQDGLDKAKLFSSLLKAER